MPHTVGATAAACDILMKLRKVSGDPHHSRHHTPPSAGLSSETSLLVCPPAFTSSILSTVQQQRWSSCHHLIQTGELLRGRKYQIVMRWRPDIRPLTEFPPLADPVWSTVVPGVIITPGFIHYDGSTATQVRMLRMFSRLLPHHMRPTVVSQ